MTETAQEERIMHLWDAGLSIERIAESASINLASVKTTVSRFASQRDLTWQNDAEIASRSYFEAIESYRDKYERRAG